jgi:hypothetical protein
MAFQHHSTDKPVELSNDLLREVADAHAQILAQKVKDENRENTRNARYAVTKPSTIPPWSGK